MTSSARHKFEVLVVGGGPAGMAAAARAGESGAHVGLVDDNFSPGGQIWRGGVEGDNPQAAAWLERLQAAGVVKLCRVRVFHQPEPGVLLAETKDEICELRYDNLILATGARERFLPFPGWTLPNVMGAGGLQAMVKSGLSIRGKRVVVAGTGPLLLAVAAGLRKHGAEISMLCEQTPWSRLVRFGLALAGQPSKIIQCLQLMQLMKELAGVPFASSSWPIAAHGKEALEGVTILRRGKAETVACDYLACGFHLVPNTELAALAGCQIEDGYVRVDEFQRTTVPGVFCAGEPTGIGGVELALVEGQIAGLASAGRSTQARELFAERHTLKKFAAVLEETFQLRPELRDLPSADTVVCRCEDVPHSRLRSYPGWRAAKLQTRCGMGSCQGRVCGPATQFLFKWNPDSVRPPIFPARVEGLAMAVSGPELEHQETTGGYQ
jgi:NADPH-dependent 2,4-dienoyl-CoA reductase/sulfur reductase-like enzyme